jgi:hypothetical protein
MEVSRDTGAIAFAERMLNLLDEGAFTATYKYAVLLALMDLCLEHSTKTGAAPDMVVTTQVAEKVVELYWPHTAPFHSVRGESVLAQNISGQAEIISAIRAFRERITADPSAPISQARLDAPNDFDELVEFVEWKLVEMPLPRLQTVGIHRDEFIYSIGWDQSIRKSEFSAGEFDNRIHLLGRAGDHLVRLAGLLRPLIQRQWTGMIARINRELIDESELEEFLFGVPRAMLSRLRAPLRELQDNTCFYCRREVKSASEIDHFIPWVRYPDNGIDNLVFAHASCNNAKRHFLAAPQHISRWIPRFEEGSEIQSDLRDIAESVRWERHPDKTLSVARAIYLRIPEHLKLWQLQKEFVETDKEVLNSLLSR